MLIEAKLIYSPFGNFRLFAPNLSGLPRGFTDIHWLLSKGYGVRGRSISFSWARFEDTIGKPNEGVSSAFAPSVAIEYTAQGSKFCIL